MTPRKLRKLPWWELPLIIILGLVVGGAFGQLTKLMASASVSVTTNEKR
jgi:hypothetical protein